MGRAARTLSVLVFVAFLGCGEDEKCKPIVGEVPREAEGCVEGRPLGIELCFVVGASRPKSTHRICVVNPAGEMFASEVPYGGRFKGDGWRHSALSPDASTLSASEESACAPLLQPRNVNWCPGTGPGAFYWEF
jgi:hypothetical protein